MKLDMSAVPANPNGHFAGLNWFKSSKSNPSGNCVEVAPVGVDTAIRDSKDPGGGVLVVDASAWSGFITGLTKGAFGASAA